MVTSDAPGASLRGDSHRVPHPVVPTRQQRETACDAATGRLLVNQQREPDG